MIFNPEDSKDRQLGDICTWAHACFQWYTIDKQIDYEEFKNRLEYPKSFWESVLVDYAEELSATDPSATLYIQRIIDLL